MRLIPRNTKVKTSFYKGITVLDIILALICLAFVALALSSNFTYKYLIALGVVCLTIPLFLPVGEERIYKQALYMAKHLFSRKTYIENGKDAESVESIVPYESVEKNYIIHKDGSFTGVLEIKPIEFRLLGNGKQDYIIDGIFDCLTTKQGNFILDNRITRDRPIRHLMANESFRLMGFTDSDYINAGNVVSDSEIYIQVGNSIAVPVLMAIFGELYGVPWREKVFRERYKTDEQLLYELPLFAYVKEREDVAA